MITRYDIINEAAATIGVRNSPEDMKRLGRLLNKVLASVSERLSWVKLRRKITVSLSDGSEEAGQEGVWLPANMAGVDEVQDQSTGTIWVRREADSIANVEYPAPRYSIYSPGLEPLFWTDDLRIDKGGSTLSSLNLDADGSDYAGDYTGEWCRLGAEPAVYKLTDARTIEPRYWGDTLTDKDLTIRPSSQQKIVAWNDHDTQNRADTVTVFYWITHPPMYRDSDELLIPYPRLVELMMLKEAKGSLGRRSRDPLNAEIDEAWKEAARLNPDFYLPNNPLDRVGQNFDPASIRYSRRGGSVTSTLGVDDWR